MHFHDHEVVVEFDEVEHPSGDQVGGPFPSLGFWEDHVMRPDPLKNRAVGLADRFRPDLRDPQVHQICGYQDAGFDRRAHRDDRD